MIKFTSSVTRKSAAWWLCYWFPFYIIRPRRQSGCGPKSTRGENTGHRCTESHTAGNIRSQEIQTAVEQNSRWQILLVLKLLNQCNELQRSCFSWCYFSPLKTECFTCLEMICMTSPFHFQYWEWETVHF